MSEVADHGKWFQGLAERLFGRKRSSEYLGELFIRYVKTRALAIVEGKADTAVNLRYARLAAAYKVDNRLSRDRRPFRPASSYGTPECPLNLANTPCREKTPQEILMRREVDDAVRDVWHSDFLTPAQEELLDLVFNKNQLPCTATRTHIKRRASRAGSQDHGSHKMFKHVLTTLQNVPAIARAAEHAELGRKSINTAHVVLQFGHQSAPPVPDGPITVVAERGPHDWTVLYGIDEPMPKRLDLIALRGNKAPIRVQWYTTNGRRHDRELRPGKRVTFSQEEIENVAKIEIQSRAKGQGIKLEADDSQPPAETERLYSIMDIAQMTGWRCGSLRMGITRKRMPVPVRRGHYMFYRKQDLKEICEKYPPKPGSRLFQAALPATATVSSGSNQ
jgi:hypothetical protein